MTPIFFRYCLIIIMLFSSQVLCSDKSLNPGEQNLRLTNNRMTLQINIIDDKLESEMATLSDPDGNEINFVHNGDFGIEVMWADWRFPGNANNGDNFTTLTKNDFSFDTTYQQLLPDNSKELILSLFNEKLKIRLNITWQLPPEKLYYRRKITISGPDSRKHFVHQIWPLNTSIQGDYSVVKAGGFGQPIALSLPGGSCYIGTEFPSGENFITETGGTTIVKCGHEVGKIINSGGLSSEWVVIGLAPDNNIKMAFMDYLKDISFAPAKPYLLYNSWYDLRSPHYPRPVPEENHMTEKNIRRIIGLIRDNMLKKHGIKLDAFVLDDGWDVYESDWMLAKDQFPGGLKPISDELAEMGTDLGIWFGPIGGYSNRLKRVQWMAKNGYETIGDITEYRGSALCLGGKNYGDLFKRRVVSLNADEGVKFYKWDGIQFSCNDPTHGHPIGKYSRKAIVDTVISLCDAVRENNHPVYLNITSGTWLSPWWIKYANQIWMDGGDYGWADVPSYSKRDAAITYRDFVLYDDFRIKDLWMPIRHLMTHGIIKGNLQKLGGEKEPIDKFTDNAVLYFARGVSMWELYISPDILNDNEWKAIAKSIIWARDNYPVLENTEMIGGNPLEKEPYGYAHFKDDVGIIAARNPFISKNILKFQLDPAYGISGGANDLVLEKIYPYHWISPQLYITGSEIEIDLEGYETAIYKVYPISKADKPLIAGRRFRESNFENNKMTLDIFSGKEKAVILNPSQFESIKYGEKKLSPEVPIQIPQATKGDYLGDVNFTKTISGQETVTNVSFSLSTDAKNAQLSFLFKPETSDKKKTLPGISILLNNEEVTPEIEKQSGLWAWVKIPVVPGKNECRLVINNPDRTWHGKIQIWVVGREKLESERLTIQFKKKLKVKNELPLPYPQDEKKKNIFISEYSVK